ncbi:MAG: TIGR01777 family oxidoreductase [Chlamydiota bacterium]
MSRILVSGASGFIGKPLTDYLSLRGHAIVKLVRTPQPGNPDTIFWDPDMGQAPKEQFEGFDAVIHLAGEPLSLGRRTSAKREKIRSSRIVGTHFLAQILSHLSCPPKVFISASAVGFYGDRGEEILTETSRNGHSFLASVCSEWEKASAPLKNRGIRVVHTRFGMVLGPNGGILQKMLVPFKLGLGGSLGSGRQWLSWIAREDLIRALDHILQNSSLEGAVNVVSPHPVCQENFSKILAETLHRPAFGNLPAWFLRLIFGKSADEMLLASTRVKPEKLLLSGFSFHCPFLKDALRKAL